MKPLEGLLVVALEQAVAAPMCSARLADAGARVIKVERPEGDFARFYDNVVHGESAYFVWLNRGKLSCCLDLALPDDRLLLERMIGQADVFLQNLKPGALSRLGFARERLRRENPRLIQCSISGYGEAGAYADRKAYDLLVQADSGLASITGGPDAPARVGVSIVDIATGLAAYQAILEALIARGRHGEGADIAISMFDTIAEFLAVPLLQHEGGMPPRRIGLAHPSIAPYGVFATKDGSAILISIQNDREWAVLASSILDSPAMASDACFATGIARAANRAAVDEAVAKAFSVRTATELTALLEVANIAFAGVNDMAGLARHPHLRRITIAAPSGPVDYPSPPSGSGPFGAVPALGEHTAAIRKEFWD